MRRPHYRVTITDCDIPPFTIEEEELAGVALKEVDSAS
jgi:hypothetical protein